MQMGWPPQERTYQNVFQQPNSPSCPLAAPTPRGLCAALKPPASCPVSSVTTYAWRTAPLSSLQPWGSVQPALSAVLKQGSFLLCGSQKAQGSCPAPTTVRCGAPASLGFVSSAIKEAVAAQLPSAGWTQGHDIREGPQSHTALCPSEVLVSWIWIRFDSPSVWPSAWSWQ